MPKTVMIADDDAGIRGILSTTLGNDPRYRIVLAKDGEETLTLARQEKPDLLFLDIQMPKMSGYEVCRCLKADPNAKNMTIVVLTGLGHGSRREALEVGADDYLTKPFSPLLLLRKVDLILGLSRQGGADVPEMGPPGTAVAKTPVGPGSGVEMAFTLDQLSRQQLETYARELNSLFHEEHRLREELQEKKQDLEQRLREIQALNRLLQALGDQILQQVEKLAKDMGAVLAQAQSLLSPGPPHAAGPA